MLAEKTRANQIVQAIFETLLQPGEQLVVICCDGNPHSVVRSSHQQSQRSTLLLDKGFEVHRFNPQNVTLLQFCQTIPRLNAFVPLDVGDVYLDANLLQGRIPDAINERVR